MDVDLEKPIGVMIRGSSMQHWSEWRASEWGVCHDYKKDLFVRSIHT